MIPRFLWIAFAGALGTSARYLVGLGAARAFGSGFPYATLIVNVVGCFLISVVMEVALSTTLLNETARLALTTGFMGGLTTYSSFNYETTRLFQNGSWAAAALNFGATTLGCVVAGLLGLLVGRRLFANV